MIDKILNIKKIDYSLNLKKEIFFKEFESTFEQGTLNFVGEFTNKNEFKIYDKWTVIGWMMPNVRRKSAYLKGKIIKSGKKVLIKANVQPNPILSVFAVVSILIGLVYIVTREPSKGNNEVLLVGGFLVLVGVLCYFMGVFLRNRLQKNFENSLNL